MNSTKYIIIEKTRQTKLTRSEIDMLESLKSAIKKLAYSKKKKMMAGNQLRTHEKVALIVTSTFILGPIFIGGIIIIINNINYFNL